jgi:hypothetical protein
MTDNTTKEDKRITLTILLVLISIIVIANVILGFCIGWDKWLENLAYITQNVKPIA